MCVCVSIGTLPLEPLIKDLSGRLVVNNNDNELFCSAHILKSFKHQTQYGGEGGGGGG